MKLYYASADVAHADIVIYGLPFDKTSSFIPGSRLGPQYIRQCAENIEDFSPYQNKSLCDVNICDLGDIRFRSADWLADIEKEVRTILHKEKIFIFLGGEHTVTFPVIKAFKQNYPKFSVIQFDAHCDLRNEYLGEKVCHATTLRRVGEIVGIDHVYQFGIRSGTKEEFAFNKNLYKFKVLEPLKKVVEKIKEPFYVTIDIDVLDPGVVPAVSTPEPGGISYRELIDALVLLRDKEIIGADIVEYNPLAASPWASGSTTAEILRELILLLAK
jgi:agmatinase